VTTITDAEIAERVRGQTVPSTFVTSVRARPDAIALRWKHGDAWREWTWADYAERACRFAGALADLGIGRGDRIVLMMRNRPEFHVADMGALLVGATPISIYNSSAADQIAYLAGHCNAKLAVLEDDGFRLRFDAARPQLPVLEHVVQIEPPVAKAESLLAWDELLATPPVELERAAAVAFNVY
jgi:long-chain acyl-CoA synthetase